MPRWPLFLTHYQMAFPRSNFPLNEPVTRERNYSQVEKLLYAPFEFCFPKLNSPATILGPFEAAEKNAWRLAKVLIDSRAKSDYRTNSKYWHRSPIPRGDRARNETGSWRRAIPNSAKKQLANIPLLVSSILGVAKKLVWHLSFKVIAPREQLFVRSMRTSDRRRRMLGLPNIFLGKVFDRVETRIFTVSLIGMFQRLPLDGTN